MTNEDGTITDTPAPVEEPVKAPEEVTPVEEANDSPETEEVVVDKEEPVDTPEKEEYSIDWGDFTVSEEFSQIATGVAKEAGLDRTAAGQYTSKVIQAMQESVVKAMEKDDAALKEEWGSEYNSKVNSCKAFIKQHAEASGLTEEDVNVLFSPKGYKLVASFMKLAGESEAQIGQTSVNEKAWAQEVQTNPNHPDYKAFHDRTDPRYEELSKRWYKAHGMKV